MKLYDIFILLRPKQWLKNSFVLAALIFAVKFLYLQDCINAALAAIIFCFVSSSIYIFNDIIDCEKDRIHPKKKLRPLASGKVSKTEALVVASILLPISLICSYTMGIKFMIIIGLYILNNILYSLYIKHIVILDVMSIAAGFLLRVIGGAFAISVAVSPWILLCTLLLALFLGFSKRRSEILTLKEEGSNHRKILEEYSVEFIDQMLSIVTASIVTAYSMYTFSAKFQLMATIPFVLYGIFRYQYILYKKLEGGNPEETVISDKPLMLNIILWVAVSGLIMWQGDV